jgi:hypothetical protein
VGKPEGKRPLGRPSRRWEDGIRMNLRETSSWECRVDPIGSGKGAVEGSCEYGDEPLGSGVKELVNRYEPVTTNHEVELKQLISPVL